MFGVGWSTEELVSEPQITQSGPQITQNGPQITQITQIRDQYKDRLLALIARWSISDNVGC